MFLQLTLVRWRFQSCIMRWKCGPSKWPLLEIHHSSPNWPWERYLTIYCSTKHWSTKQTKDFFNKGQISLIAEFLKYCIGQCEHTLYALAMGLLEKLCPSSTHPMSVKMTKMCDELQKELQVKSAVISKEAFLFIHFAQELLGDDGVLLCPPNPTASFYHNQSLTRPFNFAYVAIFNIFGFPITQVPLGLGSWGVPLGVQVYRLIVNYFQASNNFCFNIR